MTLPRIAPRFPRSSTPRFSGFFGRIAAVALGLSALCTGVVAQDYTYSTFSGIGSKPGNLNGAGGNPLVPIFNFPFGIAINKDGNLVVSDSGNAVIRVVTPAGVVTNLAGTVGKSGTNNGSTTDPDVTFNLPHGPAVDASGNVYVADYNGSTIRKITSTGTVTTLAGTAGSPGNIDGTGAAARFNLPSDLAVDSAGNVYVADSGNHLIRKITPAGVVTTVAGTIGTPGNANGKGTAARFNNPRGLACDATGNLYVADTGNNTIRKIAPDGEVTSLAGASGTFGSDDGAGASARFSFPNAIAVDTAGNLYVADELNSTIRKITPAGVVTTLAGLAGSTGRVDGSGSAARFDRPTGLTVDSGGNVYVADYRNHLIRKVSPAGVVTTLAGAGGLAGFQNGTGFVLAPVQFRNPTGTAVDSAGNIYVSDTGNNSIRRITPDGTTSLFAGNGLLPGSLDGVGSAAYFTSPSGIAVDGAGNVFVADSANHAIRRISPAGEVTTYAGVIGIPGYADGANGSAKFDYPSGVAVDGAGNLYVADYSNHVIRMVSVSGTVSTLAGVAGQSGGSDGVGGSARFRNPRDIAIDAGGNLYVADSGNHTIRKISPGGLVVTLAGNAGSSGAADGTGSSARFNGPAGLTVDASGNIFVADTGGSTIRKVTPAGSVSTIGGTAGSVGNIDATAANARFNHPTDVAVDASGNLFIADNRNHSIRRGSLPGSGGNNGGNGGNNGGGGNGNNGDGSSGDGTVGTGFLLQPNGIVVDSGGNFYICDTANHCIRRISSTRVVTVFAGRSGSSGTTDGTGDAARFNSPSGIAIDSTGNLVVTDTGNSTIRKITSAGAVTTFAGTAGTSGTADGTGTAALFSGPTGIASDSTTGDLYVADSVNATIRKITSAGVVTTYAGTARVTGDVDGVGAAARFNNPTGLAIDASKNILIADTFNNTIRLVRTTDATGPDANGVTVVTQPAGSVITLAGSPGISGVYDGSGDYALFSLPQGISVDSTTGFIYIADTGNNAIRRMSPTLAVTTMAGIAGISGNRSGNGERALFNQPKGIMSYSGSTLMVTDTGNSILRVVSLSSAGNVVSTVALIADPTPTPTPDTGGGSSGGGGGGAPSLWFLAALAGLGALRFRSAKGK